MQAPPAVAMSAEWLRVELLAQAALARRQGDRTASELKAQIADVQAAVVAKRQQGLWEAALGMPLTAVEMDIVACAMAPEVAPGVAWLFASLQPGTQLGHHASPSIMHEILALDVGDLLTLQDALASDGRLSRAGLLRPRVQDAFSPVRPSEALAALLSGRPVEAHPPEGTLRVDHVVDWNDLVLPSAQQAQLRAFIAYVKHRELVIEVWGARADAGPIGLFSGASGTGKTMAASIVASELGWPLYRVDLGRLVSKYIGETEKNLNALFEAADGRPMVLLFDEADSLFGRRGDVSEARDRYANMEVSHLLSRLETHIGPCILTSNLRGHLDQAFLRRFDVVIDFPRPDATARTQIWDRALPPRAPLTDRRGLIQAASAVDMTGGAIRNAARHATFLAASDGRGLELRHLAVGIWRELAKDRRDVSPVELRTLANELFEETT